MKIKNIVLFSLLFLFVIVASAVRLLLTRDFDNSIVFSMPEDSYVIYRIVPLVAALIVGSGLGVSGMALQVLLRNPLASPWILGLSSGAGLGLMSVMFFEYTYSASFIELAFFIPFTKFTFPLPWELIGAVVGAVFSLTLVYCLSRRRGGLDPIAMVLVGVVVSVLCSAGIMILQHAVPLGLRGAFTTWLMGNLPEVADGWWLSVCGVIVIVGIALIAWWGPTLDAACLSDDEAKSVGVNLSKIRRRLFLTSSTLAAVAVVLAGPIAFVGLIAPHGARLLFSGTHRVLTIGTAIMGALLLVVADDLRQLIDLGTGRLPIGIMTSIFGGLVFLFLLIRGRGKV